MKLAAGLSSPVSRSSASGVSMIVFSNTMALLFSMSNTRVVTSTLSPLPVMVRLRVMFSGVSIQSPSVMSKKYLFSPLANSTSLSSFARLYPLSWLTGDSLGMKPITAKASDWLAEIRSRRNSSVTPSLIVNFSPVWVAATKNGWPVGWCMPISNWPSSSLKKPLPVPKSNFSQPVTLLSSKSSITLASGE